MLTKSILQSKIAGIRKDAKSIRGRIQTILAHTAAHVFVHGDVTLLDELFRATKGVNQKLMAQYIQENCYAKLQKTGTFKSNRAARKADGFVAGETSAADGDAIVAKLSGAAPWFTQAESARTIVKELDIAKQIEQLDAKIEKAKGDTNVVVKFDRKRVDAAMARLETLTGFAAA